MLAPHEPLIEADPTLVRTYDHRGRAVYRLQDGTRVDHTKVNGNVHIFLPMDKCILSTTSPNPDPHVMTHIIHYNHNEQDCLLENMCWATKKQKASYYKATTDLILDPRYRRARRMMQFCKIRMRRYRRAQEEFRRFGCVVHLPWYNYPT